MTPVSGRPQVIYANRASEFVFKGIKGLTKSGLSVGEKSAFWLYEKVTGREEGILFVKYRGMKYLTWIHLKIVDILDVAKSLTLIL